MKASWLALGRTQLNGALLAFMGSGQRVQLGSREKWTWASSSSKQQPRPNNKPQVNILILILLRKEANNKQTPKSTHVFSCSFFSSFLKKRDKLNKQSNNDQTQPGDEYKKFPALPGHPGLLLGHRHSPADDPHVNGRFRVFF